MTEMSTTTNGQVSLSWKMTRKEKSIEVWYRVDNRSDKRIYVCDKLLALMQKTRAWRAFPAVSIQNIPGKPDTAQIVVGTPPTDANSMVIPPVTFKPVEPGQSHEDTRQLGLPLTSYNVMGMTEPLDKRIKKAILIVQSFVGDPPAWRDLPGEDGTTIRVPDGFSPRDLQSDPLLLP